MTATATATATDTAVARIYDDNEYEYEYGTPRPTTINEDDTSKKQYAARLSMLTFSQAAKYAAAATKRRRSPKARTDYSLMNRHVERAFCELESQVKYAAEASATTATTATTTTTTTMMTQADFNLLKQAIRNLRVKLIVHNSKSYEDIKQLQAETKQQEDAAEREAQNALNDDTVSESVYFAAKDRHDDLKAWSAELKKELNRIEPKIKYTNIGGGLFRHEFNKPAEPPGVPSQHAHIAPPSAHILRNILTPETARRTFISLASLTHKIREELCAFLTDSHRHKDRNEVIKQIKEHCVMAKKNKKQQ
jgi:hypothetical protein